MHYVDPDTRPTFKMLGLMIEEMKTKLIVEKRTAESGEERSIASKLKQKSDAIIQELKGKVARLQNQPKLATV